MNLLFLCVCGYEFSSLCVLVYLGLPDIPCVFAGVFVLLQAYALLQYLRDRLTRQERQALFYMGVGSAGLVVFLTVIYLSCIGECLTER